MAASPIFNQAPPVREPDIIDLRIPAKANSIPG
jgi:hypothetical protein